MTTDNTGAMLRFSNIEKTFSGVRVLKQVSFDAMAGRITGVVGENGAGKSTLMNLVGGNLEPDSGEMWLNGERFEPGNAAAAKRAGIAFVHQELNLFPNLSIAENLFLTAFPMRGPLVDKAQTRARATTLISEVGLQRRPETLVEKLSSGERQLVEIAAALGTRARVLILDEPTTSLTGTETGRLFHLLRRLREQGMVILYISHALGDVLSLCDDIIVLRDGSVVGQGAAGTFTAETLVTHMVGRKIDQLFPQRAQATRREPVMQVQNLSRKSAVRDVSFTLHAGEVLGISGLMGAGRTELARILFGLDAPTDGTVALRGRKLSGPPHCRVQAGVAFLTESRREDGLCMDATVGENTLLVALREHARRPLRLLDFQEMRAAFERIRQSVRLQGGVRSEQPVKTLSGGNQQKVVLAKWLLARPAVLILDEPTRGIDVGAKFEIYQLIHQLADSGAGVLVISSDIEELIGICDRILVMCQGRLTEEVPRAEFDREQILRAALPTQRSRSTA